MNYKGKRYAVHDIRDVDKLPFLASEYSYFKYGDVEIANKYGEQLALHFIKHLLPSLKFNKLTVYSSPYKYLPTASFFLTKAFINYLKSNEPFLEIIEEKIERNQTYTDDYGALSAEQRYDLIKNDTYKFKSLPDKDSALIFIDDISITGTHQIVVERLLKDSEIDNYSIFLYFAKLSNKKIHPNFENYLNYFSVKDLHDLTKLFRIKRIRFTTRTVKFILSSSKKEFEKFIDFLEILDNCLIYDLHRGAINNDYDSIDDYSHNFKVLEKKLGDLLV